MQIRMDDMVKSKISGFYQYYSQYRDHILNLLDKEKSNINSTIGEIEEKITLYGREFQNFKDSERELKADNDLPDEHLSINAKVGILEVEMDSLQLGIIDNGVSMQFLYCGSCYISHWYYWLVDLLFVTRHIPFVYWKLVYIVVQ